MVNLLTRPDSYNSMSQSYASKSSKHSL
jgi:hypothetical protein